MKEKASKCLTHTHTHTITSLVISEIQVKSTKIRDFVPVKIDTNEQTKDK